MQPDRNPERVRLCAFFFLHANALGLWSVNLSNVLKAHGYGGIVAFPSACNSIAALISPLAIGAFADRHMAPERVLRRLGLGSAFFLALLYFGIQKHASPAWVLVLAQLHALWSVPTFGLSTSMILSRLHEPRRDFGPVRLWATVGWMSAGWIVSWVLAADESVISGYAGSVMWLATVVFSFSLKPTVMSDRPSAHRGVRELLGLDALPLLRHHDHGIVFITAALLNMVLAAFYPFTPLHLDDLHVAHPTAVMSLGQITEMIAMLGLASLMERFRLKWVFLSGIAIGVARYALFILDTPAAVCVGIFLHGFCFTLFVITAQIYLERRIAPAMRARAQALLTLMMSGIGNLAGSLGCAAWRHACQSDGVTDWRSFWTGMTLATVGVLVFFGLAYRGRGGVEPDSRGEEGASITES